MKQSADARLHQNHVRPGGVVPGQLLVRLLEQRSVPLRDPVGNVEVAVVAGVRHDLPAVRGAFLGAAPDRVIVRSGNQLDPGALAPDVLDPRRRRARGDEHDGRHAEPVRRPRHRATVIARGSGGDDHRSGSMLADLVERPRRAQRLECTEAEPVRLVLHPELTQAERAGQAVAAVQRGGGVTRQRPMEGPHRVPRLSRHTTGDEERIHPRMHRRHRGEV